MGNHFRSLVGAMLPLTAACGGRKTIVVPAAPPPRPAPPPPAPKRAPAPKPKAPPKPALPADEMRAIEADDRIYYDDAAAFTDSVRLTIRDAETWDRTWLKATQAQATPPALPDIDFRRYMALLVSAGPMKPGDEIRVDSAGFQSGRPLAVVRITVECQPFPGISYPTEIVRVPRSDSAVTFEEVRAKSGDC